MRKVFRDRGQRPRTLYSSLQKISACLHERAPCEKVMSCKTDYDCNRGQCQGISSSWPYAGKVIIDKSHGEVYLVEQDKN